MADNVDTIIICHDFDTYLISSLMGYLIEFVSIKLFYVLVITFLAS